MHKQEEEKTLVLIKPDGVARNLAGKILSEICDMNLRIMACKFVQATDAQIDEHLPNDPIWILKMGKGAMQICNENELDHKALYGSTDTMGVGLRIRDSINEYLHSGPMIAFIFSGCGAIKAVRDLIGHTLPEKAKPGTIRFKFRSDTTILATKERRAVRNIVHASSSTVDAEREINVWFPECLCKRETTLAIDPLAEMSLDSLIKEFWRNRDSNNFIEAAQIAFALKELFQKYGNPIQSNEFAQHLKELFEMNPPNSLESAATTHVMIGGIHIPNLLHHKTAGLQTVQ